MFNARCIFSAPLPLLRRSQSGDRRRRAEAGEEVGLLRLGAGDAGVLDVAKTADLKRQRGERGGGGAVFRCQRLRDLVKLRLVLGDELALAAALGGPAKDVERGAAQPA